MEIELGLKITHTRDDATSSTEFRFAKDRNGPLFFSRETATMFILVAYLRGFKRENIEIKISEDGKQLTIGGKKPVQEITLRGWIMHKRDEIREFKKVFLIPDGVNLNRTKAKFNNEESTLRITMPKLVKGICGIEIQEVAEEHKERHGAPVPVDDLSHGKECETEISEVEAIKSMLKDRESLEEGAEARIERKEKINDVAEKAVDAILLEKDSQVEQGELRGCESMTSATVDDSSQTDGTLVEKVEATIMSKKEKTDHAADQALDAFQGDEQNQLEQDEFQGDKQDQVEQAFVELQSDKHDQVDRRDVSRSEPKAPPVVTDETSHEGGKSVKEDAESVTENKMDQMVEQQHDEADRLSDVSRRELEIPQAMIDETTQKDAKLLEKDAESMMPSKLDQSVDKPQRDKADMVQLSEVSRYEPKMSQVKIDENIERDIGEAQPDKVKKKQLGKLEIPEAMIDGTQKNDGKPLERGLGSMMERKEDQIEKHLNGETQSDKVDHSEKMEVSSYEPQVPQIIVGIASQKIENSQEDGAELMTESKEKKRNQYAEQVVDEQHDKSSQKDRSSMEEIEAHRMRTQEKTDHVVDQAFAEFPGEKRDQVGPSFDKFQIDEQDQMNQRDVSSGEPEASLVVTDETSQKVKKSLEEYAGSMMERKKDQLDESQHDEADKVQRREVTRCVLEIPKATIDETAQKDVKSREEDAESMIPSKVDQMVDKPQHDEADQVKPKHVSRDKPKMPQATIDEAIANDIGEALGDKVDSVPQREVLRRELEMQEAMIDETMQEDGKPQEEGAESMMKIKEKIDHVHLVDHAEQSEAIYAEQSEVRRNEPEVSEDIVDEISRKEPVPEAMVDVASGNEEKSYEDGAELMTESKEKKTDEVAEQVVDAQQHDKADHMEKCEGGKFLEEVAQPMMKKKKIIDLVDEHEDGDQQSDKVDYAEHTEVRKYEPEVPAAMVDAASQKEEKSLEESREMMRGSEEKQPDEVVEQVVDEHQYDKADHVEKREISWLEYEMPAVPVDEASPEDGKFLEEAADTMTKNKEKNFQAVDKVFDEPECDQMDHARQRVVRRSEPKMPPAIIDDPSGKDGISQEAAMEFVKQVIDEHSVSGTDTNQVEKREASRFKNEMPDVVADETSLKDDYSREKAEAMMKSKEKIDQGEEKAVEQDKAGGVDDVQPETESRKLITEEKSIEPENKGSKRYAEEKLSETEPKEMQAIAEVMPQTIASMQSEEATPEKKELLASFLETISPESLETQQAGQEQFTDLEPEVARGTVDLAPENVDEGESKKEEDETLIMEAEPDASLTMQSEEAVEVSPEIDSIKPMVEEKIRDSETEITEETAEKTIEKKAGEREIKKLHGFTEEVPETIESTKLDEVTPTEHKLPASTSYSDTKILDPEVSEPDQIGKKGIVVDAASDEVKQSLEETEKPKTDSKEERDHVTGHAADEWQFKKVEELTEVSPPLDSNRMMSEEKIEKPDIGIMEETAKVMDEKVDEGESRKLQDVTQLVAEIPTTIFQVEEPSLREVTETSGVKSEKQIEEQQMTEPITQQSQQGNEVESENILPEMFFEGPTEPEPEPDQKVEQVETTLLADQPVQSGDGRQDEFHGLYSEIESEKMETQVIPEGPMRPETDKEEEQVETPVLADKQGKDKGREKAKVHDLGKEIEELHDELQLPEKKETEELGYPETEMQKDFRIEQTSRKMDPVVPIKCKLRSFLFFAGSTFLLPLIVIVIKKSLIEFKSKKR